MSAVVALFTTMPALLVPTPPSVPIVRAAAAPAASFETVQAGMSPFPAPTLLLAETMSPAKARIEAAKLAQQEKLAQRGYGELAPAKEGKAKAADKFVPTSFAEAMEKAVAQREDITGKLTDDDYKALEKKVRAANPGLL